MKTLLTILFLFVFVELFAQSDSLCQIKGHVNYGQKKTYNVCNSYLIENDSITIIVYPDCVYREYVCKRCGQIVYDWNKEERFVIWRKGK